MTTRPSREGQCEWSLGTLARSFFTTSSEDSLVSKAKKVQGAVDEIHHQLWPGVPTPKCQEAGQRTGGQLATLSVPTSVMMAYVLHMSTTVGRTCEYRARAHGLLRALFDRACAAGNFVLDVLQYSEDLQTAAWVKQTLRHVTDFRPWTDSFYSARLAMQWSLDVVDSKKPCVSSLPPNIHPADFVCFSMDCYRDLRRKMPAVFEAKMKLQGVALSILTQLAAFLDANIQAVTLPLQLGAGARRRQGAAPKRAGTGLIGWFKRARTKRLSATVVWDTCAQVAELLFTHQEGPIPIVP